MRGIRAVLLLCVSAAAGACAGANHFTLKPLSTAEMQSANASLDRTLLPDGAGKVQVAGKQSFHVQIAGSTDVTLIPVRFSLSEPGLVQGITRDSNRCGLFLVDASGKSRFDEVADSGLGGLIQCEAVEAVGLARSQDSHPKVIIIYSVHTVHRSWSEPYLVSWSNNDGRYVTEALAAPAGAMHTEKVTIARARSWVDRAK